MTNPTLTKILEQEKEFDSRFVQDHFMGTVRIDAIFGNDVEAVKKFHRSSLISLYEGEVGRAKQQLEDLKFIPGLLSEEYVRGFTNALDNLITHYQEILAGLRK